MGNNLSYQEQRNARFYEDARRGEIVRRLKPNENPRLRNNEEIAEFKDALGQKQRFLFRDLEVFIQKYNLTGDIKEENTEDLLRKAFEKAESEGARSIILQFKRENEITSQRIEFNDVKTSSTEEFLEWVGNYLNQNKVGAYVPFSGSDAEIYYYDRELDLSSIWLKSFIPARGGNFHDCHSKKFTSKYYKAYGSREVNNDCLFYCIKKVFDMNEKTATIRKTAGIEHNNPIALSELPMIEEKLGINIFVYNDYAYLDCHYYNNVHSCRTEHELIYPLKEMDFGELNGEKIINVVLKDNHYYFIEDFIDIKCELRGNKRIRKKGEKLQYTHIITYDLETIYDVNKFWNLTPYSIAWVKHNIITGERNEYFKFGFNCIRDFIEFLNASHIDERYYILGYNNSRFDNYLFCEEYYKSNFRTQKLCYTSNSILTMTIKNHSFYDLNRFLAGSLRKNCIDFGLDSLKESFDHNEIQGYYNRGVDEFYKFFNTPANHDKLKSYNIADCTTLLNLFLKFNETAGLLKLDDIKNYQTIGQLAYASMKKMYDEKFGLSFDKIYPKMKTAEDDEFVRNALTAGRTQAFVVGHRVYADYLKMVDVCSLYPFVMSVFDYPMGEDYKKFNGEKDVYDHNKLGIYNIIYYPKQDEPNILAFRNKNNDDEMPFATAKDEILDWDYKYSFKTGATTADIDTCIRFGHKYKIIDGIVFDNSAESPFKPYIDYLFQYKQEEDAKPKAERNESLRNTIKLFLNSVSGKVIQRNYKNSFDLLNKYNKDKEVIAKYKENYTIDNIGGNLIIHGELKDEYIYKATAKPSYLGVFIYSYARSYMYNFIHKFNTRLYMDTDSLLMENSDYEYLKKLNADGEEFKVYNKIFNYKNLVANEKGFKILGDLEEEAPDKSNEYIGICAKSYCIMSENIEKSKFRFKGVNLRWALIDDENLMGKIKSDLEKCNDDELIKTYNDMRKLGNTKYINYRGEQVEYSVEPDVQQFFKLFYNKYYYGHAYIFTFQLKRDIKSLNIKMLKGIKEV